MYNISQIVMAKGGGINFDCMQSRPSSFVAVFQDDDVNVTFEDQQKINKFARKSNKLAELHEEIANKKVKYNIVC